MKNLKPYDEINEGFDWNKYNRTHPDFKKSKWTSRIEELVEEFASEMDLALPLAGTLKPEFKKNERTASERSEALDALLELFKARVDKEKTRAGKNMKRHSWPK